MVKKILVLYENVLGYSLFKCKNSYVQKVNQCKNGLLLNYRNTYKKIILIDFVPFVSINHAFQNIVCITESVCNSYLLKFVVRNLNKSIYQIVLGISDFKLAANIYKITHKKQIETHTTIEITRIIRTYYEKLTSKIIVHNLSKAQSNTAYLFCRSKIKFTSSKNDNMITQANFLVEQIDNDINTLSIVCKEWYSWHFPELSKFLKNNYIHLSAIKFIGNKNKLGMEKLPELGTIIIYNRLAKKIFQKAKVSTGSGIIKVDLLVIKNICSYVLLLNKFEERMSTYLKIKLSSVAPNLTEFLGKTTAAKLISHTGSLKNLAKLSSSTVQLLGSENSFFQNLKIKKNTRAGGLLFNLNFLFKIKNYQRGNFSKYIANKSVMAARIDYFSNTRSKLYGKLYRKQIANKIKALKEK